MRALALDTPERVGSTPVGVEEGVPAALREGVLEGVERRFVGDALEVTVTVEQGDEDELALVTGEADEILETVPLADIDAVPDAPADKVAAALCDACAVNVANELPSVVEVAVELGVPDVRGLGDEVPLEVNVTVAVGLADEL